MNPPLTLLLISPTRGSLWPPGWISPSLRWIQGRAQCSLNSVILCPCPQLWLKCHFSDCCLTMSLRRAHSVQLQLLWFPPAQEMRDQEWNSGFPLTSPENSAWLDSGGWLWAEKFFVLPALVAWQLPCCGHRTAKSRSKFVKSLCKHTCLQALLPSL